MTATGDDRVTVVVATRNRRETLLHTLPQHGVPTIVVDNGSTDDTASAVKQTHPNVRAIRLETNLGAAARNVGVTHARTPYVAFADDDSYWDPGSLTEAARLLDSHPRAALLCARVLVGGEGRVDAMSRAMAAAPLGWSPCAPGPRVLGFLACAVVVRRTAFLAVGGFNELLGSYGEEDLLALDLVTAGWELAYVDSLVVHHHPADQRGPARSRSIQEVRNRLLTAWLRRRTPAAMRITLDTARAAITDPAARAGLAAATRHAARVVRLRRPVSPQLERQLKHLAGVRLRHAHV